MTWYPHPGFADKLYWRQVEGIWHCFKKRHDGTFQSLCDRYTRKRSGGQQCSRPPVLRRCALCDSKEIQRRDREESLPESPNWRDHDR